jgi:hypothetical protein
MGNLISEVQFEGKTDGSREYIERKMSYEAEMSPKSPWAD